MRILLPIIWLAVIGLLSASVVCSCLERGIRPFGRLDALAGRLTEFQLFAVALAVSLFIAYGGSKTNEPPRTQVPRLPAYLYDPLTMPPDLVKAHAHLDESRMPSQGGAAVA